MFYIGFFKPDKGKLVKITDQMNSLLQTRIMINDFYLKNFKGNRSVEHKFIIKKFEEVIESEWTFKEFNSEFNFTQPEQKPFSGI